MFPAINQRISVSLFLSLKLSGRQEIPNLLLKIIFIIIADITVK